MKINFWLLPQSFFSCGTNILVTEICSSSNIYFAMFIHSPLPSLQDLQNVKYLNLRHVNMKNITNAPQRGTIPLVNLRPMVISKTHTLVLGIACTPTILNIVWRDILLPRVEIYTMNNTLVDAYLWITNLDICTLSINWGSQHLRPSDPNRTLSNFPWTIVLL